jgi:hypothetical protein
MKKTLSSNRLNIQYVLNLLSIYLNQRYFNEIILENKLTLKLNVNVCIFQIKI